MPEDRILNSRLRDALPIFTALAMVLLAAVIIAALYVGREVFVPLAFAILLSFVLAPLVRLLQRLQVPRAAAVIAVVAIAFGGILALGTVMVGQVNQLASDLPRYQSTMLEKIQTLKGSAAGPLGRAADILQDLGKELGRSSPGERIESGSRADSDQRPIAVEIRDPEYGPLRTMWAFAAALLHPLATAGMAIVFVIFILLQREDLRNRFIRIAGAHDLQKTTAALDDAAERLSRLFLTQLALNSGFGVVVGLGLWLIGVPSAVLWGILAGILRFVPYVGAFIAAAFPLTLAIAVDPGWSMLLWTVALFVIIEPIVGQMIEPLVQGHSTGLSPLAVVLAATFWTLLWGPIGLVLATPLTVCLVVLGRHTERFQFIDVLLGDEPALSPPQVFYQRMLAGDPTEAVAQAEEFLKEKPLAIYYDEVALEGLRLAHEDLARGALDSERQETIRFAVKELVTEIAADDEGEASRASNGSRARSVDKADTHDEEDQVLARKRVPQSELRPEWRGEFPAVCVGGRDILDEGAALMIGQLLTRHGLRTRVLGPDALATENLAKFDPAEVAMVCLSFMDVPSLIHIRYAVRRIRRVVRGAHVMVAVWRDRDPDTLEALRKQTAADSFVISAREALDVAAGIATTAATPLSKSAQEPKRELVKEPT